MWQNYTNSIHWGFLYVEEWAREVNEQHFYSIRVSGGLLNPPYPWEQGNSAISPRLGVHQTCMATLTLSSRHLKALGQIFHRGWGTAGMLHFCRLHTVPSDSDNTLLFWRSSALFFCSKKPNRWHRHWSIIRSLKPQTAHICKATELIRSFEYHHGVKVSYHHEWQTSNN